MNMDRDTVTVRPLHESSSDAEYWRSRPPEERLDALETIRREYHDWPESESTDEDIPRLQRVCRICQLS